ncbi:MAG: CehA/McbA family metallohydrolase [Victivallaceae bacterium]|nr:CehA/McbA family metallohydrolase [Victivallaceae bacterium]
MVKDEDEQYHLFNKNKKWFKANLHTHSTNSDGELSPAEVAARYRQAGYDVLAITDHDFFTQTDDLGSDDFLLIPSAEYHPVNKTNPYGKNHHLVCLNLQESIDNIAEIAPSQLIKEVNGQGGYVIAAHPYWLKQGLDDLLQLDGIKAIEVYNATCEGAAREFSDQLWDTYCTKIAPVATLAVDDCHFHSEREFAKGWVWINAEKLDLGSIMKSIHEGNFYASSGPEIHDVACSLLPPNKIGWRGLEVKVSSSPAVAIAAITLRGGGKVFAENNETITFGSFILSPEIPFFRIEITDSAGEKAWSNPIFPNRMNFDGVDKWL